MKKFLLGALLLPFSLTTMAFAGGHAKLTFALVPKAMNNPFLIWPEMAAKKLRVKSKVLNVCTLVLASTLNKSRSKLYKT